MGLIFNGNGDVIKAVDGSLTVEGLDIGGSTNIEAGIGTFSGNLNVGGVLTYEDVKNVDSVGIVTARTGVKVLAGGLNVVGASYFNNNIVATASTATSVTVTDESSDTLTFPLFVTASVSGGLVQTENLQPQAGSNFYFNSSTGALSATSINGNIVGGTVSGTTGTFTGDVDIADKIIHTGDTNTAIRFPAADTVTIETGGDERLRINSSGDVGIGVDPASGVKLHIKDTSSDGAIKLEGTGSTLGTWIALQNNDATANSYTMIQGADAGGQGTSEIKFINVNNSNNEGALTIGTRPSGGSMTERLRITSAGLVGIGSDSPSYKLQVHNSDGALFRVLTGHEGTYDLRYVYQNSEANIWSYGSTDLTFGTRYNKKLHLVTNGPGKRLTIDGSGLVGIGDESPTVSLSLKRNQTSNHYVRVENINSSTTYTGLSLKTPTLDCQIWNQGPSGGGYGGANSMNFYQSGTYGPFAFYHGTDERFRIETDGDFRLSSGNAGSNYGWIRGWQSSTGDMIIGADQSATGTGTSKSNLIFRSRGSEKMRVTSDGFFLVNCQDTGYSSGYTDMTIGNTSESNTGLTIASSSTNGYSRIHFADGTSGGAKYAGFIAYAHSSDTLLFGTGNTGSTIFCLNSDGAIQFGNGSANGGNYSNSGAINLIDFGSGTLNRGMGWGGTNANYANIWTEYSSGALHLGMGIRPTGTSTGWVSSYGGGAIGRSALKMDLNGSITIFTGDSSTIAAGGATNLTQKWYLHRTGQITHQFAGRYGTVTGSTDGSGAYFLLDGEAGSPLASGSDYFYMEHTSSGMFEMWNGKTGVQTTKFMDVHPEGYMRLPKKPLWDGDGFNTSGSPPAVQANIIPLRATRVNVNQGGHFDNSTGVFTCPVTGYYQIHGHVNRRASYAQWIGIYVILNGVTMSSTWWPPITADATAASGTAFTASHFTYMPLGIQHTFYCSANDELSLCYHQSYSSPANANDVAWHIELIA